MLGLPPEEILGKEFNYPRFRTIHEDGSPLPPEAWLAPVAQRSGRPAGDVVIGVVCAEGQSSRWLMVSSNPIPDPTSGAVQETVTTLVDISELVRQEEKLQARARQQAVVAQMCRMALDGTDLERLMNRSLSQIARALEVEYCNIMELLPQGQGWLLRAGLGWKEGSIGQITLDTGGNCCVGYTLLSSQPVVVADLPAETRFSSPPLLQDHGVVSGISSIIQLRGRPFGVLGVYTAGPRTFTEDDVSFIQSIAQVLAAAIERTEQEETTRRLSTPVLQIQERLLLVPIVGVIDSRRAAELTVQLLNAICTYRARAVVIDLTGVAFVDSDVANHLVKTVEASRLLGAAVIVTGISSEIAQSLVKIGTDLRGLQTAGDLRSGIENAQRWLGHNQNAHTASSTVRVAPR